MISVKLLKVSSKLVIVILFLFGITSCQLLKVLKYMEMENVEPVYSSYKDKQIIFAPLVHFGKEIYYEDLKDSIIHWKNQDYRVYYEGVNDLECHTLADSLVQDTTERKWRKITGGHTGELESYQELEEIFEGNIIQPSYEKLGVTDDDINVDVYLHEVVQKYEEIYGEVDLDDCDWSTALDSAYTCNEHTKNSLDPIIIDYRNKKVAERIKLNNDTKIVVLFGVAHIKGISKNLKSD